jgi:hypothetical protein
VILVTLRRSENMGEPIIRVREIPDCGPVCRELWLYSRYEALRFFRIENAELVDLGPDGRPVTEGA